MVFQKLIVIGILGSIVSMLRFSKYCRLLNRLWTLEPETAKRYQDRAKRWLAAMVFFITAAVVLPFLAMLFA